MSKKNDWSIIGVPDSLNLDKVNTHENLTITPAKAVSGRTYQVTYWTIKFGGDVRKYVDQHKPLALMYNEEEKAIRIVNVPDEIMNSLNESERNKFRALRGSDTSKILYLSNKSMYLDLMKVTNMVNGQTYILTPVDRDAEFAGLEYKIPQD